MHLPSERLDVQFQHVPRSSQVWGGNNSCTRVHISTYPLTCQHSWANLTHVTLQGGAGGRDGHHEVTRQHVIARSRPTRWPSSAGTEGVQESISYPRFTQTIQWYSVGLVTLQTPGLGRKPLIYLSCPKEHCSQALFQMKERQQLKETK